MLILAFLFSLNAMATDNSRLEIYEFVTRPSQTHFTVLKTNMNTADIFCDEHIVWGEYLKSNSSLPMARRGLHRPDPMWVSYFDNCRSKLNEAIRTLVDRAGEVVVIFERDEDKNLIHFEIKKLNEAEQEELRERKRQALTSELNWMGGI